MSLLIPPKFLFFFTQPAITATKPTLFSKQVLKMHKEIFEGLYEVEKGLRAVLLSLPPMQCNALQ